MIRKYGREFNTNSLLDVELYCFGNRLTVADGALGRTEHFIRICKEIWPNFEWHEWALEMAEALCEYEISGFTSGASSGKSEILAKFVLVSWFSDPVNTLCIVCSTTAVDARQKIWGHIVRNYREARSVGKAVGTLVESMNIIRLSEKSDGMAASDNSSISLVAAGDAFKDDALKRLQGRHQKNVMLALDELQDCSQEIITTALGNLSANIHFEVHAAGNASSRYDAHGIFLTPVDGWNSINRYTHKWKIRAAGKDGMAYHFDVTAENSPNVKRAAAGLPQISYLRLAEASAIAKITYGENNAMYLRQYVGFWPTNEADTNYIVTDASLAAHEAYDRADWASAPTEIAGIDPSFSTDGDRFGFHHLRYGLSTQGVWTVEFTNFYTIKARPIKGEDIHRANIRECKKLAQELNISPRHVAMDASAGSPLLSIAHQDWSPEILGVSFGGSPSELPISSFDKRLAKDVYANKTSEIAYVFVEFLNAGQVRGVKPDHAKELTARRYELGAGGKIKIEPKGELKKRLGFSPDIADSGNVGLTIVRERLKVHAGALSERHAVNSGDWKALQRKRDVVSRSQPQSSNASLDKQVMDSAAMNTAGLNRIRAMLTQKRF